jgi:hypothetical protein
MTVEHRAGWNEVRGALAAGVRCPGGRPLPSPRDRTKKAARRYRDALTGRFVRRKHAKKNTKTTESTAKPA